jgi:hypothetical protein
MKTNSLASMRVTAHDVNDTLATDSIKNQVNQQFTWLFYFTESKTPAPGQQICHKAATET